MLDSHVVFEPWEVPPGAKVSRQLRLPVLVDFSAPVIHVTKRLIFSIRRGKSCVVYTGACIFFIENKFFSGNVHSASLPVSTCIYVHACCCNLLESLTWR